MASLINKSKEVTLTEQLDVATSFRSRAQGLIGCKEMPKEKGMWFPKCNWIHTFFMSIPIDVIYLDKQMKVKKIQKNLKPWKLAAPVFMAHSVVEFGAGFTDEMKVEVGDLLHVGD